MRYFARVGERQIAVEIEAAPDGGFRATSAGGEACEEAPGAEAQRSGRLVGGAVLLSRGGLTIEAGVTRAAAAEPARAGRSPGTRLYTVTLGGRIYAVTLEDALRRAEPAAGARPGGRAEVCSVMPGKIVALLVQEGQEVVCGQGLVVIEAMKMENEITAPRNGRVSGIRVRAGETVEAGASLLAVE